MTFETMKNIFEFDICHKKQIKNIVFPQIQINEFIQNLYGYDKNDAFFI